MLSGSRRPSEHAQTASRADLQTIQKSSTTPSPSLQLRHVGNGQISNCATDVSSDSRLSQSDNTVSSVSRKQYFCICDKSGHSPRTVVCSERDVAPSIDPISADSSELIDYTLDVTPHSNDILILNTDLAAIVKTENLGNGTKSSDSKDIVFSSGLCPPESVELQVFTNKNESLQNRVSETSILQTNHMEIPSLNDISLVASCTPKSEINVVCPTARISHTKSCVECSQV